MSKVMRSDGITPEEDLRQRLWVQLQQEGGDPSALLELLCLIVEERAWEKLGLEFHEFVETPYADGGASWTMEDIESILSMNHRHERSNPPPTDKTMLNRLAAMRETLKPLVLRALNPSGPPKKNQNASNRLTNKPDIIRGRDGQQYGDSASYKLARLKRDYPTLAEKVIKGELKPHAAAVEAGFANPKVSINLRNLESAAGTICRKLDRAEVLELIDWLYKELGDTDAE